MYRLTFDKEFINRDPTTTLRPLRQGGLFLTVAHAWRLVEAWSNSYGIYCPTERVVQFTMDLTDYTHTAESFTSNRPYRNAEGAGFIMHYASWDKLTGTKAVMAGNFLSMIHAWRLLASWQTEDVVYHPVPRRAYIRAVGDQIRNYMDISPELNDSSPFKAPVAERGRARAARHIPAHGNSSYGFADSVAELIASGALESGSSHV